MRFLILFLLLSQAINAQKYFTRNGLTEFKASTNAFVPIKASNNNCSVIFKINTGDIAALIPINAFEFKIALMQEHFNENYMDSYKFPKATFEGKIKNFNIEKFTSKQNYLVNGVITIRGVSKNIEIMAEISRKDDFIVIQSNFSVKTEDFGIKVPRLVRKKIAKEINISLNYELIEKK